MELDYTVVSELDRIADRHAAGIGFKDDEEASKIPMPFGAYQFVYPDPKKKPRLAVTCLVKTCVCPRRCNCEAELAVMFYTPGIDVHDYPKQLFSSLKENIPRIKCHKLAPLIPTARIINAARIVSKMQDSEFAVKTLLRKNSYEEKKVKTMHELNLSDLNPSQANAVKKFIRMESGVMAIQGPPGSFCVFGFAHFTII